MKELRFVLYRQREPSVGVRRCDRARPVSFRSRAAEISKRLRGVPLSAKDLLESVEVIAKAITGVVPRKNFRPRSRKTVSRAFLFERSKL